METFALPTDFLPLQTLFYFKPFSLGAKPIFGAKFLGHLLKIQGLCYKNLFNNCLPEVCPKTLVFDIWS